MIAFLLTFIFAAYVPRPAPCVQVPPIEYVHTGREDRLPVYVGEGEDRQVVVFCVHSEPDVTPTQWPTHIVLVYDAPEIPEP